VETQIPESLCVRLKRANLIVSLLVSATKPPKIVFEKLKELGIQVTAPDTDNITFTVADALLTYVKVTLDEAITALCVAPQPQEPQHLEGGGSND